MFIYINDETHRTLINLDKVILIEAEALSILFTFDNGQTCGIAFKNIQKRNKEFEKLQILLIEEAIK